MRSQVDRALKNQLCYAFNSTMQFRNAHTHTRACVPRRLTRRKLHVSTGKKTIISKQLLDTGVCTCIRDLHYCFVCFVFFFNGWHRLLTLDCMMVESSIVVCWIFATFKVRIFYKHTVVTEGNLRMHMGTLALSNLSNVHTERWLSIAVELESWCFLSLKVVHV